MSSIISQVTLVVPDYDSGIEFYVGKLGFDLLEDSDLGGGKRWVRVAPKGAETALLLAEAATPGTAGRHRQPGRRARRVFPQDRRFRRHV